MDGSRRAALATLLALAALPVRAAAPAAVRSEIDVLLARLAASGCTFYRNGSWYPAADAKTHLLRKLDYLERRGSITSTEQFIDLAASGSSESGEPYRVRCGTAEPVTSAAWLRSELALMRGEKGRKP